MPCSGLRLEVDMGKILRDGLFLRGKIWWMSFTAQGRHYRESTSTSNKKLADSIRAKKIFEIAEGRFLKVKRDTKQVFRDFAAEFMEKYSRPNKRSWKSADDNSIKQLNRFFGDRELSAITQGMVEEYVLLRRSASKISQRKPNSKRPAAASADKCLAPATVNRELSCLKTMFAKAVEWGRLESSPCTRVKKLKEDNCRTRFLSDSEIERLFQASNPRLREVITVLIHTGMRKGELQGLKWSDLDFNRGLITLPRTKSGKVRYIPMNGVVKQTLLQRRIAKESPALVFPGTQPDKPWDFCTAFDLARVRAGLPDVRIHDLRHTFASHLCMKGADIMTVKELLGHSSLEMTQRYSHLTDHHKADAVARLERLPIMDSTFIAQSPKTASLKVFENSGK
jgi:integrase